MTPTTSAFQTVPYTKPHATYDQQVAQLQQRGLVVDDPEAMKQLLAAIGYYRLTAYVYPFREMLPAEERCKQSPTHYRSETIEPGTTFEMVADLWRFDRHLRNTVLDAVETVEVGLKSRIAYVLGRRDKFGHLRVTALNEEAASKPHWANKRLDETSHEAWLWEYDREIGRAREDYIKHNIHKYDDLPVWIGLEPATFGQVVDLYKMLKREDQQEIAVGLGIKNGRMLSDWLSALRYLRNEAAHHARMWNRVRHFKISQPKVAQVGPELAHLATHPVTPKIYSTLAVAAYLARQVDPGSNFHNTLKTRVRRFPLDTGFSPEVDMGFPTDWDSLDLWR